MISFPQGFTAELREYLQKLKEKDNDKKGKQPHHAANPKAGAKAKGQAAAVAGEGDPYQGGRVNSNLNPLWKLPEGIEYAAAFYAPEAKGKSPRHNNQTFCLNYFVLGKCKPGCTRLHTDPRAISPEMEKAFTEFCTKQYERCKKAAGNRAA